MYVLIFTVLLVFSFGISSTKSQTGTVELFPRGQRVAEGSQVLLTCITSLEQATFKWYKPVRELKENKDLVKITQVSANMSTLEIPSAHVKRHKRTFKCTVSTTYPTEMELESNTVTLKVMPRSRVSTKYPWITVVRQEAKYQYTSPDKSDIRHVSTEVQCQTDERQGTRRPTKWRWILGSNSELRYTNDFKSGRLEKTPEGHLLINNPKPSDFETTYTCVAENNWGTAYSNPIMLNKTEPPVPKNQRSMPCLDRYNREIPHGHTYQPEEDDPCVQCECSNGSRGRCISVSCDTPTCEVYEMSKDTCCEYTCLGGGIKEKTGECKAHNGTMVPIGKQYNPEADACLTCICSPTGPSSKPGPRMCVSVNCRAPPMPCDDFRPVPGKCCVFTCDTVPDPEPEPIEEGKCRAFNGTMVPVGQLYNPQADPCVTCMCTAATVPGSKPEPSRCISVSCRPPPMSCDDFKPVPGKCCVFTCDDVPGPEPEPIEEGQCRAFNGTMVPVGQLYNPEADPCVTCICAATGPGSKHGPRRCASVSCRPPPMSCDDFKPVPGKCCVFTCDTVPGPEPGPIVDPMDKDHCIAFNGTLVPLGQIYSPEADPCLTCMCSKTGPGSKPGPGMCASVSCIAPQLSCKIKQVPGKCCEFVCDDAQPGPKPEPIEEKTMRKVLGHVYVQQNGPRSAMVHWKLPSSYDQTQDKMSTFYVYIFDSLDTMGDARKIKVTDRMYVVLEDFDHYSNRYILVNGTSDAKTSALMTRPVQFLLQPRGSSALFVSDSLGVVYESRGSIPYTGYSLPRQFNPIIKQRGRDVVYNLNSFHMVEVSTYDEAPCPNKNCGLLRFYMYETNGEMENRMSLMFVDNKDFLWAKSHL